ncbi:MAG: 50S ribosomal protein L29 [Desulfomonilia bacterium]|jgi:large subunit ribosomal protein L29|uniref:Large ribosomal subunit protein uL29 n=1 Tax=anaerobic digester metagenome TaxID=1263854 RepID=A0A485LWQ8_9ZZZZ|nr:50S ribosomal protein L29 [Pseudomonadota bacterium]HON39755.1 50S ribosomal protein L29 [Deltaproteobacteria bacterium]HRS57247.1 50S ribosomal protein L29 [Desulfomonilia bacterium]HPD22312.1 50S ribosomal protein L29 [Deltaproteobacteria bacterium]HPW69998.1 50S ribosomal protein L29 [Deltaproteobacteria bacterium]
MKASELREKTVQDLGELKNKLSRDLMNNRFRNMTGQLENKSMISKLRRDIARINTIIREKMK